MTTPGRPVPFQASIRLFSAIGSWLSRHSYAPRWMPPRWRHPAIGYLAALLLALVAGALTLLLSVILPPFTFLEALLVLVAVLVALNWGQGPSLFATLIGAFLLASVITPPSYTWDVDESADVVNLGLFLLAGGTVSLVASDTPLGLAPRSF